VRRKRLVDWHALVVALESVFLNLALRAASVLRSVAIFTTTTQRRGQRG
jgi:hypothetical protein